MRPRVGAFFGRLAECQPSVGLATGQNPKLLWRGLGVAFSVVLFAIFTSVAFADEGSFTNSGGSTSAGATGATITSSPTTPGGTLSLSCPGILTGQNGTCSGGSLTYASSDGTTSISASFSSGTFVETCSGGGRGGHVTCSWAMTGYFSGALTVNGVAQAINGVTYQAFGTGGAAAVGTTGYNSAYTPFYYSDSEQILRSDDLQGTNQITYGSGGSGVGQFYGAYGIALDAQGRINVADTYNCRVVRIDDMKGTNWTTYGGTCGSGQGQFYDPTGIAVDSLDRIYVLDGSNSRVVRIDDMTGTNWTSFGTAGTGVNQFEGLLGIAVDSSNRIYVVDANRLIRFDDMTGTNWTVLTQSPVINGVSYLFDLPTGVAVDSTGKIYVSQESAPAPSVVRIDDMLGDNWTTVYTGGTGLNSVSVDPSGIVIAGGSGAHIMEDMTTSLNSSGSIGPFGSYYVFGVTAIPLTDPRPSAIGLTPTTLSFSQNVGTTSAAQPVAVSNFGGSPLNLSSFAATGGFAITPTCPSVLTAGATCSVGVTFTPSSTATVNGQLTFTDNSGNAGTTQSVTLTGTGTTPAVSLTPTKLSFAPQLVGTTSAAQNVVVKDTGTGPLQFTSVSASGPFSLTTTCSGTVAPNASCTVSVSFAPTVAGPASGTLTIVDNAGTQTAPLSGVGNPPVSFSPSPLSFGSVVVGNTSATKSVTLVNNQSVTLNLTSVVASTGYNVTNTTCGTSLAALGKCTISLTFSPSAVGVANGTLTVTDDATGSPQTLTLTGTGTAPVTLSTTKLSFGSVPVGTTSAPKSVTVTNHESASLSFSSIVASAGFAISSNTCGASIAANASCTIGVTFTPTATGAVSGTLTFTDSALTSPQIVTQSGTGK